jgi:tripartite-type tricarboxylate transporter receptor subunit TctC
VRRRLRTKELGYPTVISSSTRGIAGPAVKIMTGDEYARYCKETHDKAKKYTEWAKKMEQK